MTFTKNKIAAAVTGTLLASVGAQQAHAILDFDNTANTGILFASEILTPTTGVGLAHATDLDIKGVATPNAISTGTQIRTTLTLSSGTFTATPTLTYISSDGTAATGCTLITTTAVACAATTLFSGGTATDSTVTFNSVSTLSNTIIANAHFLFTMAGITVTNQSAITGTVSTAIADNFGATQLADNSGAILSFGPLLSLAVDTTASAIADAATTIHVNQGSLFFSGATGDDEIIPGGVTVVEAAGLLKGVSAAGAAIDADNVILSTQQTVTAASGFAAFNQGTATDATDGSVSIGGVNAPVSTADATLAVAPAIASVGGGNTLGTLNVQLTVPTGNTVVIDPTTLTVTTTSTTAGAIYSGATSTGTLALRSLARNGSAASLSFATNPTSAYPMHIRVTNTSALAGPVSLTLTNDDGDTSAAILISTITGGPAGDLGAGASTGLLSISDVFTAVTAADATFALGATSNKLRVNVTSVTPAILLNAFTLSSDGTTFAMVTDAGDR